MDIHAIRAAVDASLALKKAFFDREGDHLLAVGQAVAERVNAGGRVLAFGNGGSAADAQHLVAELVGRFGRERRALSAIALSTDPSVVTAVTNDMGFAELFARQVEAHGRAGDVAIGISTSGRSPNVVAGLRTARRLGLLTIGITGAGGGEVATVVDHLIAVPHADTPRVQEVHVMVLHCLCQIVEEALSD
jgi:D-sedoheptulose 7-phosphate isomerase